MGLTSKLFDQRTFYPVFRGDLAGCKREVIIESPFITFERTQALLPIFLKLLDRNVKIYVLTRNPKEHDAYLEEQSEQQIRNFEQIGVQVFVCEGNHHRKLAILDRKILWEGSLNILSQSHSHEIMRRVEEEESAKEMFEFLKWNRFIEDRTI